MASSTVPITQNYLLGVTIQKTRNPEISRLFSIPKECSFHNLHEAIQASFRWVKCHQYQFTVMDPIVGTRTSSQRRSVCLQLQREVMGSLGDFPPKTSGSVKLSDVFEGVEYRDKDVEYKYHHWTHSVKFLGWGKDDTGGKVVCVAGQGHEPAEDAGGPVGWNYIVEAYWTPRPDEGQLKRRNWYEEHAVKCNPKGLLGPGGAWEWDRGKVNKDLKKIKL